MFVYIIINHITDKIYVGKTVTKNLQKYLCEKLHDARTDKYQGRSHLFRAMKKYQGPEGWSIYPLISTLTTNEEICFWERVLIAQYDSQNPDIGYNICRGGEGFTGTHPESTRLKIAENSRLMWQNPEIRKRAVSNMKIVEGRYRSPGGRAGGQAAVDSGQLDSIRAKANEGLRKWIKDHPEKHLAAVRKGGQKNLESGQLAKMRAQTTYEDRALGGRITSCKQWNINRGKPCTCGKHNRER